MVYSICIPINMHRERPLIKLGKPFAFERKLYLPYINIEAILFNGVEPFEQIVKFPSTKGPM